MIAGNSFAVFAAHNSSMAESTAFSEVFRWSSSIFSSMSLRCSASRSLHRSDGNISDCHSRTTFKAFDAFVLIFISSFLSVGEIIRFVALKVANRKVLYKLSQAIFNHLFFPQPVSLKHGTLKAY